MRWQRYPVETTDRPDPEAPRPLEWQAVPSARRRVVYPEEAQAVYPVYRLPG